MHSSVRTHAAHNEPRGARGYSPPLWTEAEPGLLALRRARAAPILSNGMDSPKDTHLGVCVWGWGGEGILEWPEEILHRLSKPFPRTG